MPNGDSESGWTIKTLAIYHEALRTADREFNVERDRRYAEVKVEERKALTIKETADLAALTLAREIQAYKDEKADKTREQNLGERGSFVTHADLSSVVDEIKGSLKPLFDYVSSQEGVVKGSQITMGKIYAAVAGTGAFLGIIMVLVDRLAGH